MSRISNYLLDCSFPECSNKQKRYNRCEHHLLEKKVLSQTYQKRCLMCGVVKSYAQYYLNRGRPMPRCIPCNNMWAGTHRKLRTGSRKNYDLQRKYSISFEDYNDILLKQGGVCAVCLLPERDCTNDRSSTKSLAVHHNHTTGEVLALCCGKCNRAMGMLGDDPQLLRRAADLNDNK